MRVLFVEHFVQHHRKLQSVQQTVQRKQKKMRKLKEKEFKMKKSLVEGEGEDEPITINIVRAERKVSEDV